MEGRQVTLRKWRYEVASYGKMIQRRYSCRWPWQETQEYRKLQSQLKEDLGEAEEHGEYSQGTQRTWLVGRLTIKQQITGSQLLTFPSKWTDGSQACNSTPVQHHLQTVS